MTIEQWTVENTMIRDALKGLLTCRIKLAIEEQGIETLIEDSLDLMLKKERKKALDKKIFGKDKDSFKLIFEYISNIEDEETFYFLAKRYDSFSATQLISVISLKLL